jgi:hypothetical protein
MSQASRGDQKTKVWQWFPEKSTVEVYLKLQERNREQVVHATRVPK